MWFNLFFLIAFLSFFLSRWLFKTRGGRVIRTLIITFFVTVYAYLGGVFEAESINGSVLLLIAWYVVAIFSWGLTWALYSGERSAKKEVRRRETFVKEYRGTLYMMGDFYGLCEHPGLIFDILHSLWGDRQVTVSGHEVVLTVDTDPDKQYYRQSLVKFSDCSRPLPVVGLRNLTMFPEKESAPEKG